MLFFQFKSSPICKTTCSLGHPTKFYVWYGVAESLFFHWIWRVAISWWQTLSLCQCQWWKNKNCELHLLLCRHQKGENESEAEAAHQAPNMNLLELDQTWFKITNFHMQNLVFVYVQCSDLKVQYHLCIKYVKYKCFTILNKLICSTSNDRKYTFEEGTS